MTVPSVRKVRNDLASKALPNHQLLSMMVAAAFFIRKQYVMAGAVRPLPGLLEGITDAVKGHRVEPQFDRAFARVKPLLELHQAAPSCNALLALLSEGLKPQFDNCLEPDMIAACWLAIYLRRDMTAQEKGWHDLTLNGMPLNDCIGERMLPEEVADPLRQARALLL